MNDAAEEGHLRELQACLRDAVMANHQEVSVGTTDAGEADAGAASLPPPAKRRRIIGTGGAARVAAQLLAGGAVVYLGLGLM